jgi:hypothetical protein
MTMEPPERRPSREEIDRLLKSAGPQIERLFRSHGIPVQEAEKQIGEALAILVFRWDLIRNPEWWLLDRLGKTARQFSTHTPEEADDEEAPS